VQTGARSAQRRVWELLAVQWARLCGAAAELQRCSGVRVALLVWEPARRACAERSGSGVAAVGHQDWLACGWWLWEDMQPWAHLFVIEARLACAAQAADG
jgi:hypothetical protein